MIHPIHRATHMDRLLAHDAEPAPPPMELRHLTGDCVAIARVRAQMARVADSEFTVLITGETGTGKELVARAIHKLSARAAEPFAPIDCGAIPEPLFESELFGHRKGAFTSADRDQAGALALGGKGTVFLDEIGNLPLSCQAKLLRVVEERRIRPIGAAQAVPLQARLVTASNTDLEAATHVGTFRDDLYYRLAEFVIAIPPLRDHIQDVIALARQFIAEANLELGKAIAGISPHATEILLTQRWPGNVRQLRSVIRRAVLLADTRIEAAHLDTLTAGPHHATTSAVGPSNAEPLKDVIRRTTAAIERGALAAMLEKTDGNKAAAARKLGLDYRSLLTKVHEYGLVGVRDYRRRPKGQ